MRIKVAILIGSVVFFSMVIWLYWGNESIQTTQYEVKDLKVSKGLDGVKIAQVSDLHNKAFGKNQQRLIRALAEADPDIIVVTGDVIDARRTNMEIALTFFIEALSVAPVYYVPGNHEGRIAEYEKFETAIADEGVTVLSNRTEKLDINGSEIGIAGILDPTFLDNNRQSDEELTEKMLNQLNFTDDLFTMLLAHRPELLSVYAENEVDLVFSGHAHGGQIRIPFIGGIIAPNQGFFPSYTSGMFAEKETQMIVSRGLGNSLFPVRVNNRPELVIAILKTME